MNREDWDSSVSATSEFYNSPDAGVGIGGRWRDLMLVGMGGVTNSMCAEFIGIKVCLDFKKHNAVLGSSGSRWDWMRGKGVSLEGASGRNKAAVHVVSHSCNNFACPKCFRQAVLREAQKAEQRLIEAEKRFKGYHTDHYILSCASGSYVNKLLEGGVAGFKKYCAKMESFMKARGGFGGLWVFHAFRFDSRLRTWYFSPHMHYLGFRKGNYECRKCPKVGYASKSVCAGCHGFEAETRRLNETDGCICKMAVDREGKCNERESLFATIAYELGHATIRAGVKRAVPCRWSGVMSYRKMKVVIEKRGCKCPICGGEMEWAVYVGSGSVETNPSALGFKVNLIMDGLDPDGEPNFLLRPKESYISRFMKGKAV